MNPQQLKNDFIQRVQSPLQMQLLFNHLPDIYFFAKNWAGEFMMANDLFVHQCGADTEADVIGKMDSDFFPPERAATYMRDDRHVMETGRSLINQVELAPERNNAINWFITSKVPLFSTGGAIIGLAGTARDINRAQLALQPYTEMSIVLEYIKEHYAQSIAITQLAELMHLSVSQLERRFRKTFQLSPLNHIMNVRIRAATERLTTTSDTIATIAQDCGFYDHSHFTRNFRKATGLTPKAYRLQHTVPPPH